MVQLNLEPSDELASTVNDLAALITRLNIEPIAEHQPIAIPPASDMASRETQGGASQSQIDAL